MMLETYATYRYYIDAHRGTAIEEPSDIEKALERASRHIDTLTFNRIVARGFDRLTPFQQDILKRVTCELADFETENADMISSVLSSYSINGVSMQMTSGWNIRLEKGVAMPAALYSMLSQTGLTCRLI